MDSNKDLIKFHENVVENDDKGIVYLDKDDIIIYANEYIKRLFECDNDEIIGLSLGEVFNNLKISSINISEFKSKSAFSFEIISNNGNKKTVKIESDYLKDESSNLIGSYVYIWDLAEIMNLSNNFRESEALHDLVFEEANDGICLIDEETSELIDCNKRLLELFETTKENLLGKRMNTLTPEYYAQEPQNQLRLKNTLNALDRKPKKVILEWLHQKFNGEVFNAEISLSRFESKNRPLIIGIMRDITERKIAEKEKNERIRGESLISSISSRFINLRTDKLDIEFHWAMKEIGEFYKVDKCVVYLFSEDFKYINCFSQWRKDRTENLEELQNIPVKDLAFWKRQLFENKIIKVSNKSDIPNAKILNKLFKEKHEYKSFIISPIKDGYNLIGYWSLVTFKKEVQWSEYNDTLMSILGEIFSNAIIKKKQEDEIYESEKRFRTLIETTASLIFILQDNKIVYANKAAQKAVTLGEDVINIDLFSIIHKDYLSFVKNAILKIMKGKENSISGDIKTYSKTKEIKSFDFNAAKINYQGSAAILITATDITAIKEVESKLINYNEELEKAINKKTHELKKANANLKFVNQSLSQASNELNQQVKFFEILIENIPIPILILDVNKKILNLNKSFEKFSGDKVYDIKGKYFEKVYNNEFIDQYSYFINEILDNGGTRSIDLNAINANGDIRNILAFGSLLGNNLLDKKGMIFTFLDVTEQKEAEYEIIKALGKQKELNDLKTQFISTASHELRTPLTTILSSADYLEILGEKKLKTKNEKFFEHIKRIKQTVTILTEMMDELLILNKSELGKIQFSPEEINLKEICNKIVDDFENIKKTNQIIIPKYNIQSKSFFLDKSLIKIIINNILSNAIKYSGENGKIDLSIAELEDNLNIIIKDNGPGILEYDKSRLFEPFYRSESVREIAGSGLGLSIVKKAVELHDGKIKIQSEQNKGSEFCVTISNIKGSMK